MDGKVIDLTQPGRTYQEEHFKIATPARFCLIGQTGVGKSEWLLRSRCQRIYLAKNLLHSQKLTGIRGNFWKCFICSSLILSVALLHLYALKNIISCLKERNNIFDKDFSLVFWCVPPHSLGHQGDFLERVREACPSVHIVEGLVDVYQLPGLEDPNLVSCATLPEIRVTFKEK